MSVDTSIPTIGFYSSTEQILHNVSFQPNEPEYVSVTYQQQEQNSDFHRWSIAHPPNMEPIVSEVARCIQFVSYKSFRKELGRSLESVRNRIEGFNPQNSIVMVEGMKSNKWVAELALKYFDFQAGQYYRLGSKEACNFQDYLLRLRNDEIEDIRNRFNGKNVVLFDDCSYSGKQISDHITSMSRIIRAYGLKVNALVVVVPYRTSQAHILISNAINTIKSAGGNVLLSHAKKITSLSDINPRQLQYNC